MVGFLVLFLIEAVLFVASSLLQKPPSLPNADLGGPARPTSKEGDPLPVVWGTMLLPANVTHFSHIQAIEQKEKVSTGVFSSRNVTVGYSYSAVMQVLLCHGPIDELVDIVWADTHSLSSVNLLTTFLNAPGTGGFAPVTTETDYVRFIDPPEPGHATTSLPHKRPAVPVSIEGAGADGGSYFEVSASELFGGYKHGGGVAGSGSFYWGLQSQARDMTLYRASGEADYPALRGVCYAVLGIDSGDHFEPFNFGEFPTVPALAFLVRRCPSNLALDPALTNIGGGANPAECIYETLTNVLWGLHVPINEINAQSFRDCATVLAAEGFGIHVALTVAQTGDELISELLRYVDGQVQQNPITGLLEMSLNRADYSIPALVVLDDSSCTSEITRPTWTTLINQVSVVYTKQQGSKFAQVPTQPIDDLASQQDLNVIHEVTVPFPWVRDPIVAGKLAVRTLRFGATPLARAKITANRTAAGLKVGAPFVHTNAAAGINGHVFRVVNIDFGTRTDGKIVIDAIEDIFDLDSPLYDTPVDPPGTWTGIGPLGQVVVTPTATHDDTTGYLEIDITGANGLVTAVQFQEQSGNGDLTDWHDNVTPDRFFTSVDLDEKHPSLIGWTVLGHLKDGTIGPLAQGQVDYPISTRPARPTVNYVLHEDGWADLVIDVDQDAANVKFAASYDHVPTLEEVLAETAVPVPDGARRVTIEHAVFVDATNPVSSVSVVALDDLDRPSEMALVQVLSTAANNNPSLDVLEVVPNPITGRSINLTVRVTSPILLSGTLTVWVNHDSVDSPLFTDAPDGHIAVSATPAVVGPTGIFSVPGGTFLLFRDIVVHASRGKRIFMEFVDSDGGSSGQHSFFVEGGGGVIDENGDLLPGSLKNAEVFAAGIAPVEVWPSPLPPRPEGTIALNTTDEKLYKSVSGSWVPIVNAPDLSGQLTSAQIADAQITTTKFASGLRPVRIVTGLPGAGDVEGDTVYDTVTDKLSRWTGGAWISTTAATDITGQITSTQIASGAIDVGKFAAGIRPVMVGSTLPTTATIGDTFLWTFDQRLYRWNGSGWTNEVPSGALSGQVVSAQIAAGAIDQSKFVSGLQAIQSVPTLPATNSIGNVVYNMTDGKLYRWEGSWVRYTLASDVSGQIVSTQISDNSISTPKLQANSVTSATIAAGAIVAGKLGVDAVTAGTIAAVAISAREIQTGAITADKIAAGAVTTNSLAVNMGGSALNFDPETKDLASWVPSTGTVTLQQGNFIAGPTAFMSGVGQTFMYNKAYIPYDANKRYRVSSWVYNNSADGTFYLGAAIADYLKVDFNTVWASGIAGIHPPAGWSLQEGVLDGSALTGSAMYMRLVEILNYAGTTGTMYMNTASLQEIIPGTLIRDGAITTAKIVTGAITAGLLSADAVTAGTIAAGAVNTRELAAGAITADRLAIGFQPGIALNADPTTADINQWLYGAMSQAGGPGSAIGPSGSTYRFFANSSTVYEKRLIPFNATKTYRVRCYTISTSDANGLIYPFVLFFDTNKTMLTLSGSYWYYGAAGTNPGSGGWTTNEAIFSYTNPNTLQGAIPITAAYMTVGVLLNYAGTTGGMYVEGIRIDEVMPGTLIENGAITTLKLTANAVTAGQIAAGAVTSGTIAAGAVIAGTIQAGAIGTTELAANAITTAKIAAGSVVTASMAFGSISGDRIATNTLNATSIVTGSINSGQLNSNSIIAGKIAAGAINSSAIVVDGTITALKMSVASISSISSTLGIFVGGRLQNLANTVYLDMGATGSLPILHHPLFDLRADGSATFSGALSAATGSFAGSLSAATGTFSGTLASPTMTSTLLQMTGAAARIQFTNLSTDGGGISWQDGANGITLIGGTFGSFGFSVSMQSTGSVLIGWASHLNLNGGQVSAGANDSATSGFKYLRVPNSTTI